MRCYSVCLLLVVMFATQHTDFESFTNALGTLPNQPPVPMACEPSPSPIDVDTNAIVQRVVDVLLKHSPSPAVHLEVLGCRWLALARNESVTNLTSTLLPAKVPAMNKRDKRAREVLEHMPVTPDCPKATIALLMSQASTHRSAADIKILRRCGAAAVKLAEAGLKQPTSATSKVVPAATIKALDAHHAAEHANGGKSAWTRAEDIALLELHAGDLPMSTHHAALVNRSHSARRGRMLRLQKHVGGLVRATFSKSITNQAGPLLELHYGRWTRLSPDLALPENAQVDWLNGVARAPAAWDLQLDPDAIVLFDAARDEWIDLDSSDLFMLPDVRRSMTLHQIMNHVENWMQTKASPGLPERIKFKDLRFALLPSDLKQPAPFEEAVAAAAPSAGQSVLYHRADGSTARASVKTVNVPPPPLPPVATPHTRQGLPLRHEERPAVKPTTFTIVVEDGSEVCTVRERLSRDVPARAQGQGATSSSSLLPYDNVTFPDPHSTVEAVDLYNQKRRLIVTNVRNLNSGDRDVRNYWAERRRNAEHVHNARPRAVEHLTMLNNLTAQAHNHGVDTHLPNEASVWAKLSRYATSIAEPMTCVCFQCGMVNHRSNTHVITVRNVTRPRDCRAYRVFRYYIRRLQRKERERIGDDVDGNEVNSSVFLCNPCDDGVIGANVYACTACKTACACKDAEGKRFYEQCTGAELDLFDGFDEEDHYVSNGIGERQAPEYRKLSVHDRLALSVLNMGDALFKAYGGAGYTHSAGGGLLQPQDFHGMAALLVEARPSRDVGPAIGEQGSRRRQRAALERLRDPIHGNPIIEETLTCLERELNGSQPLLHEESSDSDDDRDESDDERRQASRRQRQRAAGTQSALARPPPFVGAAVSVLPLPQAADHERVRNEQIIGDKRPRDARGCDNDLAQAAASDEPMTSPDNATHTVLFPLSPMQLSESDMCATVYRLTEPRV